MTRTTLVGSDGTSRRITAAWEYALTTLRKDLHSWDGSSWVTATFTGFEYSSRCFLDRIAHPDGTVEEMRYDCKPASISVSTSQEPRAKDV